MFNVEDSINKEVKLVVKLNKLTDEGKLKWDVLDPPSSISRGTDDYVHIYYETEYKNNYFALYILKEKNFSGEYETFYWVERYKFIMLDSENRVVWESTQAASALPDLLETIREKSSGIEDIFNSLLSDDD